MPAKSRKIPAPGQLNLSFAKLYAPALPDKIPSPVHTLMVGFGPGKDSAEAGHYYAGRSNYMWKLLYESAIWPDRLSPEDDNTLVKAGFGFTDVIKRPTDGTIFATASERMNGRARIRRLVQENHPRLVVFVGLESLRVFLRRDSVELHYGHQPFKIHHAPVFLVPSTSGASVGNTDWWEKLEVFDQLKATMVDLGIFYGEWPGMPS